MRVGAAQCRKNVFTYFCRQAKIGSKATTFSPPAPDRTTGDIRTFWRLFIATLMDLDYDKILIDMKQQINNTPSPARHLTIVGILMIILTPFIQPLYIAIAQSGCPMVGGRRECGFDPGLQIAMFAETLPVIWLIIGIILLITGIVHYSRSKKNI